MPFLPVYNYNILRIIYQKNIVKFIKLGMVVLKFYNV
jgi:hypothetical protein